MISSAVRRFSLASPRLTPPSGSLAKTASSMSPSSSRRVGMMPTSKQGPRVDGASPSSTASTKGQAGGSADGQNSLDDVLTVGGVSSHCGGEKISRAAEGSI